MDLSTARRPAWLARRRDGRAFVSAGEGFPIARRSHGRGRRPAPNGHLLVKRLLPRAQSLQASHMRAQRGGKGGDHRARMTR